MLSSSLHRRCTRRGGIRIAPWVSTPSSSNPNLAARVGTGEHDVGHPSAASEDLIRGSARTKGVTGQCSWMCARCAQGKSDWCGLSMRGDEVGAFAPAMSRHCSGVSPHWSEIPELRRRIGLHGAGIWSIGSQISVLACQIPSHAVWMDSIPDEIAICGDQMRPIVDDVSAVIAHVSRQNHKMPALVRRIRWISVAIGSDVGHAWPLAVLISAIVTRVPPLAHQIPPQAVRILSILLGIS